MIISPSGIHSLRPNEHHWESDRFEAYWKGFLFIPGVPAGAGSLECFVRGATDPGIPAVRSLLKGQFFLAVRDKRGGPWQAFVDSGGLFHAYYGDNAVATSLVDLVRQAPGGPSADRLNADSVVEFINIGYLSSADTLFEGIRRISADKILSITPEGVRITEGRPPGIQDPWDTEPLEFFGDLAASLAGETVSVDLTGGADSRLVAVLLDHVSLEFEAAIAGMKGYADVEISRRLAETLNHPHRLSVHTIEDLEATLPLVFRACDGQQDILSYHRVFQHQRRRAERGVTLTISGLGGEWYKDTYFVHDLPFYNKRTTNVARMVRLRMLKFLFDGALLGPRYRASQSDLQRRVLERLERCRMPTNTQTYDRIAFYHCDGPQAGRSITNSSGVVPMYAPLLELDLVRYGFALPRWKRFFNNYHRDVITRLNPAAARLPTPESRMTVSSRTRDLLLDAGRYVWNNLHWATEVWARRLLRRPYGATGADHPDLIPKAKTLNLIRRGFDRVRQEGILAGSVTLEGLNQPYLGRCVTLGLLLDTEATR